MKKSMSCANPQRNNSSHMHHSYQRASSPFKNMVRRRVATQFSASPPPQMTDSAPSKKAENYQANPVIINMNRQRMQRYMRTLHRLSWMALFLRGKPVEAQQSQQFKEHMRNFSFDRDSEIQSQDLNYMISRRYNLLSNHL